MSSDIIGQEIIQGLYLGSLRAAGNFEWQIQTGITHILTMCEEVPWDSKPKHVLKHMHNEISDFGPVKDDLDRLFKFIDESRQEGKILVHCFAGRNRSASIVIAYLMYIQKISWEDAYSIVEKQRQCIMPFYALEDDIGLFFTSDIKDDQMQMQNCL